MANQAKNGWEPVASIPKPDKNGGLAEYWRPLILAFLASEAPFAKVDLHGGKAMSVTVQLLQTAKRHQLPVKVHKRGPDVYLARVRSS